MTNVGKLDQAFRLILGLVLIALFLLGTVTGLWGWVLGGVGLAQIATAAFRFCPAYRVLGINTCGLRRSPVKTEPLA